MTKTTMRARYTLEFKQEAVRLVEGGQSIAAAARTLGVVDQTLFNWVKAHRAGKLTGVDSQVVSAEQMEISRLRAELARVTTAISRLPSRLREALVLRTIDGLGQAEAAEVLGVSEKTVETRLYRARAKLKAMIGDQI